MRPSYVLVDYENVHCLMTDALTLRHSRTCGVASKTARPGTDDSHLAERQCAKPAGHHWQELVPKPPSTPLPASTAIAA